MSIADEIEKLFQLLSEGKITDDEFIKLKKKLINEKDIVEVIDETTEKVKKLLLG